MAYDYKLDKKPKSIIELTVTIPIADIKPRLEEAANKISETLKLPGFRPGHVPFEVVKGKVGELAIYEEAAGKLIEKSYIEIILKEKIETVGSPQINMEKIAPDNDLVYKAIVSVIPKVVLGDYKKIKIKQQPIKVEPKEIDSVIENLRQMRASEVLEDKAIEKGDKADIDFDGFLDNVPFEGGSAKKYPLIIGSGQFIPGFEENLIGLKANDTKEFKITFPADYGVKNLAGKEVEFKIKVHGVYKRNLAELNADFAKNFGMDSIEKMREQIEHSMYHEQEHKRDLDDEVKMIVEFIDLCEFEEIPEILINAEINKMVEELHQNVAKEHLQFEEYLKQIKKTVEQLKLDFIPDAIKRVKSSLAIRALFLEEKMEINPAEVEKELAKMKLYYNSDPELLKNLESPQYKEYVENMVGNRMVLDLLRKHCLEKSAEDKAHVHEH